MTRGTFCEPITWLTRGIVSVRRLRARVREALQARCKVAKSGTALGVCDGVFGLDREALADWSPARLAASYSPAALQSIALGLITACHSAGQLQ